MGAVIGDILPLALGVAVSPIPIIATILMLMSPQARLTSLCFALGWVAGIVVSLIVVVVLASVITPADAPAHGTVVGILKLLLGAALLLLAVRQWRGRPKEGEEPSLPGWMTAIDQLGVAKALGLGVLLAAANPKNLLLAVSAGVRVGAAPLSPGSAVAVVVVYTGVAASTVVVPVVGYLLAASAVAEPLASLRRWLESNVATVMAVLLLVLGVVVIGSGLGSL